MVIASDSASWDQLIEALKSIKLEKIPEDIQQLLQWKNTTSGMQLIIATMKICIFTKKINVSLSFFPSLVLPGPFHVATY